MSWGQIDENFNTPMIPKMFHENIFSGELETWEFLLF